MKRRVFLAGAVSLPVVALSRPEALLRKARFEEVGTSVLMTVALPGLVKPYDTDALASIDSGFDTTLQYNMRLLETPSRKVIGSQVVVVKVRFDPWKKKYVVSRRSGKGWAKQTFTKRDDAIKAATTLSRVRVASTSDLERGDAGPYYFVEVLAMRNPRQAKGRRRSKASGRGGGRDLEWFGNLVDVLVGEKAKAEETVHVRTYPFYLVPL